MDVRSTSLKIDKEVREAARQRANELNKTFQSYFEGLIFKDLELNEPKLFKMIASNSAHNITRIKRRSAAANKYDPNMECIDEYGDIILNKKEEF